MTITILQTKLNRPLPRPNVIARNRLVQRLDEGMRLHRKLTLVAAAAGFGKSTLVSDWLATGERPATWISIDATDNDPARFLTYVTAALKTLAPDFGAELTALLESTQAPAAVALMPALLNEIAEALPPFTLVLDDYHLIQERSIHEAMALMIEHMPSAMHLVLITRADPPLPLARLRVSDQITELRAADLRFTPDEAASFLNQRMGLTLAAGDIAALEARTEGWIAGLQLAALSLQLAPDAGRFIDSFTGSDRYILDYLMEEVLSRQPEPVHDFLLRTSILERLCGELCDAVTGRSDSHAMLEHLDDANLFVVPLDNRRRWYRYHHLFADLLRFRLQTERPQEVDSLHGRASTWFEANDSPGEAIQHALAAKAWERAAGMLEQVIPDMGGRSGQVLHLLEWCNRLPEATLTAHPMLNLYYAWLLSDTASVDAAEIRLQQLESSAADLLPDLPGMAAAVRSQSALSRGMAAEAVAQAEAALAQIPKDSPNLWGDLAVMSLVYGSLLLGNLHKTEGVLARLPLLAQELSAGRLLVNALGGYLLAMQGNYYAAARQFRETLRYAALDEQGAHLHPMGGLAQVGLGQVLLTWNQLDEAAPLIESGLQQGERSHNVIILVEGTHALLRLRWAQADGPGFAAALERMQAVEQDLRASGVWAADMAIAYRNQGEAFGEKPADLRPWVVSYRDARRQTKAAGEPTYVTHLQELAFVRALLALARIGPDDELLREALDVLESLIPAAEEKGLVSMLVPAWIARALVWQELGQPEEALSALAEALTRAAPAGILRDFLDERAPMRQLLQSLARRPDAPAYAAVLLDAFGDTARSTLDPAPAATPPDRGQANQALVEPLTARELDVLQLMVEGASNQEIAEHLHVTVGTVKSHAKRIYGKLAVGNRTEAAARARASGLV